MSQLAKPYITPEEYLRLEENSVEKHEYFQGEVLPVVSASENHSLLSANVIIELGVGLRGKPCKIYSSDIRIQVKANGLYTYADASVVCGTAELATDRNDTITNPIVVVEVTSPSTEKYDRSTKFELYRALDSMQSYLVIDQSRVYVEHHRRVEQNNWLMETFTNLGDTLKLPALSLEIPLTNLYDKVEFS